MGCNLTKEFFSEWERLCVSDKTNGCLDCVMEKFNSCNEHSLFIPMDEPDEVINTLQKWSDEHPKKTRQSEFLKLFPNAALRYGRYIDICPQRLNKNFICEESQSCNDCEEKFWLAEV